MRMKLDRDQLMDWSKEYLGISVTVFCTFFLIVALLLIKRQYSIAILGAVSIAAIGLEKRAKLFDQIVAISVVFVLALGFMLFN